VSTRKISRLLEGVYRAFYSPQSISRLIEVTAEQVRLAGEAPRRRVLRDVPGRGFPLHPPMENRPGQSLPLVEVAGFEPASENTVGSASTSLSRVFDVGPRAPTGRIARPQAFLDVTRQAEGTPPGLARLVHAPRTPRA